MNTAIECPSCGSKVDLPAEPSDSAVACPTCGTPVAAGPEREPSSPLAHAAPSESGMMAGSHDWQRVRLGIGLILLALVLNLGTWLAIAGIRVGLDEERRQKFAVGADFTNRLVISVMEILTAVGCCCFLAAPTEGGSRHLGMITFVLAAGAALLAAVSFLGHLAEAEQLRGFAALGWVLFSLLRTFALLVFLRQVARAIAELSLVRSAGYLTILVGGVAVLIVTIAGAGFAHLLTGGGESGPFAVVALLALIALFPLLAVGLVWYVHLLMRTRRALAMR